MYHINFLHRNCSFIYYSINIVLSIAIKIYDYHLDENFKNAQGVHMHGINILSIMNSIHVYSLNQYQRLIT